jgi:hypothetical protein
MMRPYTHRIRSGVVAIVAVAVLAVVTVSCGKESGEIAEADHAGTNMQPSAMQPDHSSTTGMDQSMPGMKMPRPAATNTPATGETNMSDMPMPGGEHAGHAAGTASTNEVVTGRGPVDLDLAQRQFINIRTLSNTPARCTLKW